VLVLSRHRDEEILIGDDAVITVVELRYGKVRLGISAPKDVPVHRREVYEAIRREGRRAPDPLDILEPELRRAVLGFVREEYLRWWLASPNKAMDGRRPDELIAAGESAVIWEAIRRAQHAEGS
jgi:carbon storage regulator